MLHSVPLSTSAKAPRYSSRPGIVDLPPFQTGPGTSISPYESCCGSSSTSPGSASSSFALSPHTHYLTNGSVASFSLAGPVACPQSVNCMQGYIPVKYEPTRFIPSFSDMPPPSRSPKDPSSVSPSLSTNTRGNYDRSTSHASRYAYQSHPNHTLLPDPQHPSALATPRSFEPSVSNITSTAGIGYNISNLATMHYDTGTQFALNSQNVPPFEKTKIIHSIFNGKGSEVRAELQAKIDKGFFKADQDWTCYRRNYFSVAVYYTLQPPCDPTAEPLFLRRANASAPERIQALAVCITARVNGEDGKVIELVQHTPKRDKGPTSAPDKIKLLPHITKTLGCSESASSLSPGSQLSPDYEGVYAPTREQNPRLANFDRIQFKNATANNGKRRAAQQYFHLVVELYAQLPTSQPSEGQWIKIATRMSAPMVVRGRSPGHYSDDRRSSSTSMGPGGGGSSGDSTRGAREPTSTGAAGSRSSGSAMAYSGSSRAGNAGYISHHASMHHSPSEGSSNYSSGSSGYGNGNNMMYRQVDEPVLTSEEANAIESHEGYQYYPSPLFELPSQGRHGRNIKLPTVRTESALKADHHQASPMQGTTASHVSSSSGVYAPTSAPKPYLKTEPTASPGGEMTNVQYSVGSHASSSGSVGGAATGGRGCGRFQGVDTSRGYYPATPAL